MFCALLNIHELHHSRQQSTSYYPDFLFIKLSATQARILTVFLNERQRRKLLGGAPGACTPVKFSVLLPNSYPVHLCVSGVREDWGLFWGARGLMGRSKENTPKDTREDARLRGGSLLESLRNCSRGRKNLESIITDRRLWHWWAPIRAKQLSMAATSRVMWLCACVR